MELLNKLQTCEGIIVTSFLKTNWFYWLNILHVYPLTHASLKCSPALRHEGFALMAGMQKRFGLRMKWIQCEITSPEMYFREAQEGHSWCWASQLRSIRAHCSAGNTVHASAWEHMPLHPYSNTTFVNLLYLCYIQVLMWKINNDISIQILAWTAPECYYTKDMFFSPQLHIYFQPTASYLFSVWKPSVNQDKVKACCFSAAY